MCDSFGGILWVWSGLGGTGQLAPKTTRPKTTRPKDNSPQVDSPHIRSFYTPGHYTGWRKPYRNGSIEVTDGLEGPLRR